MDFDPLAKQQSDRIFQVWIQNLVKHSPEELAAKLASRHCPGTPVTASQFSSGAFNICYRVTFKDGLRVLVCFTALGRVIARREKVEDEVAIMEYVAKHTEISVPKFHGSDPSQEIATLSLSISLSALKRAYFCIAEILLELSKPKFPFIGAIRQDELWNWVVQKRPLTFNMNWLAQFSNIPFHVFERRRFNNAADYFEELACHHLHHFEFQRNDAVTDEADCRKKYIARCLLLGVQPALPDYMNQYTELHRRHPVAERAFAWESGATGRVSALTVSGTADTIYASTSDAEVFSTMTITPSWVGATQTVLITRTATGVSTSQTSSVEPVDPILQSTGLSTGAKAGIGIAIPLAVICIASILLWYIRRKKSNGGDGEGRGGTQLPTTVSPTSPVVNNLPFEKDGNAVSELDGQQKSEIDAKTKTPIFELDANLTSPEKDSGEQKQVEEMSGSANMSGFDIPVEFRLRPTKKCHLNQALRLASFALPPEQHAGDVQGDHPAYIFTCIPPLFSAFINASNNPDYAIGSGILLGLFDSDIDHLYLPSWGIWCSLVVVFNGFSSIAFSMIRHQLKEETFWRALLDAIKWLPFLIIYFRGISLNCAKAILCHAFSINLEWASTAKEMGPTGFYIGMDKMARRFKWMWAICVVLSGVMIYFAVGAPWGWTIKPGPYSTANVAIAPLAIQICSSSFLPFFLGLN
ncbi:hypothetical protein CNMCM5878_003883 [Aspergillus fumigatiaffinis]|nr:hypothetical protein CNMCM5878_003883 [Aspergillus fumigatiaffinis]